MKVLLISFAVGLGIAHTASVCLVAKHWDQRSDAAPVESIHQPKE